MQATQQMLPEFEGVESPPGAIYEDWWLFKVYNEGRMVFYVLGPLQDVWEYFQYLAQPGTAAIKLQLDRTGVIIL